MTYRLLQLVGGCAVLGVGVGLLLIAALGSDGFSMLVSGISIATGLPFALVNLVVAATFVGFGWWHGLSPGLGTIVQITVVGTTVNVVLVLLSQPEHLAARALLAAVALLVLALGIVLYLGTGMGAGPAEAPSLSLDPPIPFRWSYGVVQGGGALVGWLLGAAIGPGTIATIVLLGPIVAGIGRLLRQDLHQPRRGPDPTRDGVAVGRVDGSRPGAARPAHEPSEETSTGVPTAAPASGPAAGPARPRRRRTP